ncbi:thioesterase domain-containing protein [Microcoleus sp. CAWBG51]|uniref:thioesterase domain-containing protein n=1 Tax=Microcoleus sp. CAWBG51 TaxID=2841648 RepID=UPI0025EE3212|nr:thioesterase domain-containing protein [Microcoleus sp. CAWBG51]
MQSESYTEKDIEQLLKDYIIQQFMYERPGVVLENNLLLLEAGIIDSLGILGLINFIEKEFDINISSEAVVSENFRTVDAIKSLVISKLQVSVHQEIIQKHKEAKLPCVAARNERSLIPIRPNGYKRPFFYVHGLGGYGSESILAHYLHHDRPFYGLQAIGLDEKQAPHTCIEEMVAHYIQEIQTVQLEGPYLLGGRCIGGNIAFEMAQELRRRSQQVLLVAMSDSPNPFIEESLKIDMLDHWRLSGKHSWREKLIDNGLSINQVENLLRVMDANQQIIVNHKPQLYSGRVVYFSAQENWEQLFDPMQPDGWNSWVADGIEVIKVPGKHGIYHDEPHVRVLAEKMNACLEQTDREYEYQKVPLVQKNAMSNSKNQLISHYQKALIIKYDSLHVHYKLAQIYQTQFLFVEASYHYIKSLQFDPNNFKNYWNLKFALLSSIWSNEKIDSSLLEEGMIVLRQTIQNQPNFPFARVVLGILLTLQGKSEEAIDSYQAASYQQIFLSHPQLIEKHWDFHQKLQPSFIIPGFMKCGTTSLYSYLSTHPQVLPTVDKELWFFSYLFEQGIDYYLAHFPSISNSTNYITGEASPIYISSPSIAKKIIALFPKMKFIILLRNPINRAFSSYYYQNQTSCEYKLTQNSITETIEKIPTIVDKWFYWLFYEPSVFRENYQKESRKYVLLPDLLGSLYIYYLKEWMTIFPREQFLILKSEDLFEKSSATMKQVYSFLNLPDYQMPKYPNHNPGSYPPIPDNFRRQLVEFFRPYNQQLEEYLGMKFNWK